MDDVQKHLELIQSYLPKYLTPEAEENLLKDIKENFPFSKSPGKIYTRLKDQEYLYQGDGIIDIPFPELDLEKKEFKIRYYKSIVLSNTCDINPKNKGFDRPYILFSSIIPINEYIKELKLRKIETNRITSFLHNLRENKISNLFYLPELKYNDEVILEESMVRLDFCISHPSSYILNDRYNTEYLPRGDRIFSFKYYGFYLFLFKISVHLSRISDGVLRN